MGWFSKSSSGNYEKSGSKGPKGGGYGKGDVKSNPNKYTPRTEAQAKRDEKKSDRIWK